MNYIKGHCKTNLDDYDCSGVKTFCAVPRKGEYIKVLYKGHVASLRVVAVTHTYSPVYGSSDQEPRIEVELHN